MYTFIKFAGPVRERDVSKFAEGGEMMGEVALKSRNGKRRVEARDGRKS